MTLKNRNFRIKLLSILFFILFSITLSSQEKILLLRFNETKKSELSNTNESYVQKGSVKKLGTIVLNSDVIMMRYDDLSDGVKKLKIATVEKLKDRTYYISKDKKWIFALTNDKNYLTQIGKKERFIYVIEAFEYVEDE